MEGTNPNPKPTNLVSNNIFYSQYGPMLSSGVILFLVVLVMVSFCCYYRCFSTRRRPPPALPLSDPPTSVSVSAQGIDCSILKALPVFVYSSKSNHQVLVCAVCLSEFQVGEEVRVLPMCNHTFHTCCIDMWFYSRSNCPLCRAIVHSAEPISSIIEPLGSQLTTSQKIEEINYSVGGSSSSPMSLRLEECKRVSLPEPESASMA